MNLPQTVNVTFLTYLEYKHGLIEDRFKRLRNSFYINLAFLVASLDFSQYIFSFLDKLPKWQHSLYTKLFLYFLKKLRKPSLKFNGGKVLGISYEELLKQWVEVTFPEDFVIVLKDLNLEARNINFLARIPPGKQLQFLEDVVVLKCKDHREMCMLGSNVPSEVGVALLFSKGKFVGNNQEEI